MSKPQKKRVELVDSYTMVIEDINIAPVGFATYQFFERAAIIQYYHLIPMMIPNFDYLQESSYPEMPKIRERAYRMAHAQLQDLREKKWEQESMFIKNLLNESDAIGR